MWKWSRNLIEKPLWICMAVQMGPPEALVLNREPSTAWFEEWLRFLSCIPQSTCLKNGKRVYTEVHCTYGSVQFSRSIMSDSLRPHGLEHARLPCPSPIPRAYLNSHPPIQWCHPTTSSSIIPFSSHLQSFPASGSSSMSQFFASGGQSVAVSPSASVLSMNI